jgi:hypothetical protein
MLAEEDEKSVTLFDLPLLDKLLWGEVILLPPPIFAITVGITARVSLKAELFLRWGPIVLRDIRLSWDTAASRYSGTAQLYLPVAAGPRATLQGSLIGSAAWLGMVELLRIEGGLRAIGQAPLLVALAPSIGVLYDRGTFTVNARPQLDAGVALIFDFEAFARAAVGGDEVWKKKWNLYHWHWGRAVRMGASLSVDYIHGALQPLRVEPYSEAFSIDELLEGLKEPAEHGSISVTPPGRRPLTDRLNELLGADGTDPQVILAALADASADEAGRLLADEAALERLRGALGPGNAAIGMRILRKEPSETVPSLDEATVFLAARHIRVSRFQDALHVVIERLQATGIVNSALAIFAYGRETGEGDGFTHTLYDVEPETGVRTPRGPSEVTIYDPGFVNVPWLFSTVMHEYVHVLQTQRQIPASEFVDPTGGARREVEAYLWEIEHARGSGVIVSPQQMEELGIRLKEHFEGLSSADRAKYQVRYDAAIAVVDGATSGALPVNLTFSIADARRAVQESSRRIALLVRDRPVTNKPTDDQRRDQERIDAAVAAIQQERSEMLVEVVLAENPNVQIVDRAKGKFRTPVTDSAGRVEWMHGSISVVWHLQRMSPSILSIGARIGAHPSNAPLPPGTTVDSRVLAGGSAIQGAVQPFPGDLDFGEEFDVVAPDAATAGAAVAEVVAEFVARNASAQDFEFVRMRIMPVRELPGKTYVWLAVRILDPAQRGELAAQLADLQGGKVNTFWRALVEGGRFVEITKVLGIHAMSSTTGRDLFATTWMGAEFQEAYFDEPEAIEHVPLAEYAATMRELAHKAVKKGDFLKAAKRAFNYLRAVGNLEGMAAVTPILSTVEARINQHVAVLDGITLTLLPGNAANPNVPTRILTVDRARALLDAAAETVEAHLPGVPGTGKQVADKLRAIARDLRGTTSPPVGMVEQDGRLAERLTAVVVDNIKPAIDTSLADRVKQVVERYVP